MKIGIVNVIVSILLATFLLYPSFSSAQEKSVGKVVAVEGKARIIHQGKSVPATLLAEIYPTDTIITARSSKLKILFIDDSILALGSRSEVSVEKFLYQKKEEKREASFNLTLGKVRVLLGKEYKEGSLYEIKTPTAVAGVRGTHFIVWVVSRRITEIIVLARQVEVRNIRGIIRRIIIRENFATRVVAGEAPLPPYTPEPEVVNALRQDTEISGEIPEGELPSAPDVMEKKAELEEVASPTGSVTQEQTPQQQVIDQPLTPITVEEPTPVGPTPLPEPPGPPEG